MTSEELLAISREPNVAAFLRVIRSCEGTADDAGYRRHFGGALFDSFSDHPRRVIVKSGYRSTAAGAYQFLAGTWDEIATRYGLPDFSPQCQDAAAVGLLIRRNALADVRDGRLDAALERCSLEWASLPGSPHGQPRRSINDCRAVYARSGGQFSPQSLADNEDGAVQAPAAASRPGAANPSGESSMAPFIAAALPAILAAVPELAKLFTNDARKRAIAETVADIATRATGATNIQAAVELIERDNGVRKQVADAVRAEWHQISEVGGGIAAAREFNERVAVTPAHRMPAVWISGALLVPVYLVIGAVLFQGGWTNEIRIQVVTAVLSVIGMVGSFWLGTSFSSAKKDAALLDRK